MDLYFMTVVTQKSLTAFPLISGSILPVILPKISVYSKFKYFFSTL